jgi:putative flippase GtrA
MQNSNEGKNKSKRKKNFIQLLIFTGFMVGAALVQMFTFFVMNDLIKIKQVWISNVVSIVFSVIFSFTLNRKFTFKEANNVYFAMFLVACYYGVFTPLSGWFSDVMDGKIHAWLIEGISMVVNFITEYLFNKFIVYRKKKGKPSLEAPSGLDSASIEAQNIENSNDNVVIEPQEHNLFENNIDSNEENINIFIEPSPDDK